MNEKPCTHPPIPPNCPHFERGYDMWLFVNTWEEGLSKHHRVWVPLEEADMQHWVEKYDAAHLRDWRNIIAATAVLAWHDEIERSGTVYWENAIMATQYAKAWIAWGARRKDQL